jgi:hypothetical protein
VRPAESGRWHLLEVGVLYPLRPGATAGFRHPGIEIQHSAAPLTGLLLRGVVKVPRDEENRSLTGIDRAPRMRQERS